jgi:steroid delta-isomerase-like uncharacterized protein
LSPTEALIRRYYAAFNAGDIPAMLACLAPDIAHDINAAGRETGRAAFEAFMARMSRCYHERLEDLVVMVSADGSRAAAEFTVHGSYVATDAGLPVARGQTYLLPGGAFFAVSDGLICRVTNYYNLQDWLRQVEG